MVTNFAKGLRFLKYPVAAVAALVALDWVVFGHKLFDGHAFTSGLSLYMALFILLSTVLLDVKRGKTTLHLATGGLIVCGLLLGSNALALLGIGEVCTVGVVAVAGLLSLAAVNGWTNTQNKSLPNPFAAIGLTIVTLVQAAFVFGIVGWYVNGTSPVAAVAMPQFSPAAGVMLHIISVLYLDRFVLQNRPEKEESLLRDFILICSFSIPILIISADVAIRFGLGSFDTEPIVAAGHAAILAVLGNGVWFLLSWNTWQKDRLRIENEHKLMHNVEVANLELEKSKGRLQEKVNQIQALNEEIRTLAEASELQAKEQLYFSSVLAHEVRTPLNTIVGMVNDMFTIGNSSDCRAQNCSNELVTLKQSTDFLMELVNSVLDYNKLKEKKLELQKDSFRVSSLFESIEQFYAGRAKAKGLTLTFVVSEAAPTWVEGDQVRLRQMIGNLVDNAIKFTQTGGITVYANWVAHDVKRPQMVFRVKDTGIGIDSGSLNRIFEAFSQANRDISKKYGGTGLGLALCKELARLMGGKLTVESTLGKGSTFSISLPLSIGVQNEIDSDIFGLNMSVRYRLLMVEDHPLNGKINQRVLESAGLSVDWIDCGEDTLEAIKRVSYDAVLMDLDLGSGMNGFDTAKQLRSALGESTIPIIALTASMADEALMVKLHDAGIVAHLEKPFNKVDALRLIHQVIKHHKENNSIS